MKWINFGERPPSSVLANNNLHFRETSSGARIPYSTYLDSGRVVMLTFPNRYFEEYKPDTIEWLDEDAYNIKDHDQTHIRYAVLTELYDDLLAKHEALKTKHTKLKQQYKACKEQ